jgi:hypothetical protein
MKSTEDSLKNMALTLARDSSLKEFDPFRVDI